MFHIPGRAVHDFWTSCLGMPGELVQYMTDSSRAVRVTYGTFVQRDFPRGPGAPAPLYRASYRDKWAISYWRSELPSGTRVYYFDWSRIEHVFVQQAPDVNLEAGILDVGE
jgi:hypothetical protein